MCFCLDISFCPWETSRCIRQRQKKRIDSPVLIGRTFESMLDRLSMGGGRRWRRFMIFETCILPYYYSLVCIMITGGGDLAHGGLTSCYWVGVFKESINFYH